MPNDQIRRRGPQRHDISGIALPTFGGESGPSATTQQPVTVQFPPAFAPPDDAPEFIISWSIVVAGGSSAALYVLDGQNNVSNGAAFKLPDNTRARISGVIIEGDTILGTPVLQFSIRSDVQGQVRLRGWAGVNLPGRGGIVNMGIEPFTVVQAGGFFGGWVQNTDGAPHYAAMTIQGWLY